MGAQGCRPGNQAVPETRRCREEERDDAHHLISSVQGPPLWFPIAQHPFSLPLEITVPFLSNQHSSISPCGWKLCPLVVVGKQRPRLPLKAFHTVGTVSGSGMSTCPKVTHMGPLFPLIWWEEGLRCWWPPWAPLGTAHPRREPMEDSRAKDGEGQGQGPGGSLRKPGSSQACSQPGYFQLG